MKIVVPSYLCSTDSFTSRHVSAAWFHHVTEECMVVVLGLLHFTINFGCKWLRTVKDTLGPK